MSEYLGLSLAVVVNLVIVAFGYGKLASRVSTNERRIESTKRDIHDCRKECGMHRRDCKQNGEKIDAEIFHKLDAIREFMNDKFLALSIQVAKIETRDESETAKRKEVNSK